jgi:hypothetical protein
MRWSYRRPCMAGSTCWRTTGNGAVSSSKIASTSSSRYVPRCSPTSTYPDTWRTGEGDRIQRRMLSPLTIRCCAPCSIGSARLGSDGRKDWAEVIADRRTGTTRLVRDQLEATGGLAVERRVLGMSSSLRYLSDQVSQAVHNAIDGLPAAPRPLAAGLLAVVGQMPTVFTRAEWSRHRQRLRELTFAAIEPIEGLHWAIDRYLESKRRDVREGLMW